MSSAGAFLKSTCRLLAFTARTACMVQHCILKQEQMRNGLSSKVFGHLLAFDELR